ncbi:hypothetical protein NW763_011455 [Fusarium oxysporum]|nr:hypothetical protein NW763_011455 [Fusarium oxysporum]
MVIASCDVTSGDKVLVFVDGVNVAKDETGTPLDSSSKYLSEPWGIPSPNGDTAFAWSSPPLRFSIPLPKTYVELKIAVCDLHDGYGDTAVMIKARPCTNCDQSFKVDYDTTSVVSTTTYEATSLVTQAASGTVRGTISGYTGVAIIYNYISCNLTSRYLITHKIASIYIIIIITRRSIGNYIGHCSGVYDRVNITLISVNYNLTSSYLIINNIVIIYITRPFIIVIVRVYVGCHIGIHIS